METGKRLVRGSVFQGGAAVLSGLIALFITPYIVHSLGDRLFGFWSMTGALIGIYGFLDLGVSISVSRHVSKALGSGDNEETNRYLTTAFFVFSTVGVMLLLLTVAVASLCPLFLADRGEIILFRKVILLMGTGVALGFPMRVFRGVLSSFLRHDIINILATGRRIAAAVLVVIFLGAGYGILSLAVITVASRIVEHLGRLYFARRIFPEMELTARNFQAEKARILLSYGGKAFVSQVADLLRFRIDAFVIGGFLNLSMVTIYTVGRKVLEFNNGIVKQSMNIMVPVFSRYDGERRPDKIREKYLTFTKISMMAAVFTGTSTFFYGKNFIERWMGDAYGQSYAVLAILAVPAVFETAQMPSVQLLYGVSKHASYAALNAVEAVVNIILSIILVQYLGIYGVALATGIEMLLAKAIVLPIIACRAVDLDLRTYFRNYLSAGLKTLLPLLAYFWLVRGHLESTYTSILALALLQTVLFAPLAFFTILDVKERGVLLKAAGLTGK